MQPKRRENAGNVMSGPSFSANLLQQRPNPDCSPPRVLAPSRAAFRLVGDERTEIGGIWTRTSADAMPWPPPRP